MCNVCLIVLIYGWFVSYIVSCVFSVLFGDLLFWCFGVFIFICGCFWWFCFCGWLVVSWFGSSCMNGKVSLIFMCWWYCCWCCCVLVCCWLVGLSIIVFVFVVVSVVCRGYWLVLMKWLLFWGLVLGWLNVWWVVRLLCCIWMIMYVWLVFVVRWCSLIVWWVLILVGIGVCCEEYLCMVWIYLCVCLFFVMYYEMFDSECF